ncbi:MAG: hypothetical protein ABI564_01305 [Ideonella sp.]
MKRNTTLTLIMMLSSVAAAVAAPDAPTHATDSDCIEYQQIAAVTRNSVSETRSVVAPVAARQDASRRVITACVDDVTAPYRRLHSGSLKLPPAVCGDVT